ncbi:DUF881 domain-containing protein [Bifidobacterium sp. ESL0763]|uniref:DUF881 domain-containing protein n=1 Tax=Bifidobacterium sp. ESL0763 TaxID=2983227 RepID=UPI0023F79B02|nr:DUF881 domain-containing protein [Bifidobacterium sp. ESL0763]MDF7663790.1 DUF881 domain-containing protein [Bifidobacterium sp. ESL0763]
MATQSEERPAAFPVRPDATPVRRRAAFSQQARNLGTWHALTPEEADSLENRHRRKVDDDSLRLIDDLTNRPLDPLFSDARLTQGKPRSPFTVWATRVIVFVICVAVGLAGSVFVRQLNTDPRKQVRKSLIAEQQRQNAEFDKLSGEVTDLHSQVSKRSKSMPASALDPTLAADEMANGTVGVKGPGVVITMADPTAADGQRQQGATPRETTGEPIRVVTDADIQTMVSLLWSLGAEAIAVNGHRIGASTSVRTAGQSILIGVDQISSPYKIEAIGNRRTLANGVGKRAQPALYGQFEQMGIHPHVKTSASLRMPAAQSADLKQAKRSK